MRFDIITIFPEMFGSIFSTGVLKRGLERSLLEIRIHNLRDFTEDKHRQVDDRPYGGEQGMVLKPEPIFAAVEAVRKEKRVPVYLLSPQGRTFDSRFAEELSRRSQIILICGRYEGVDERVIEYLVTDEVSIGDYVLSGGEVAALVIVESVSRFIPGVVGKIESVKQDSFSGGLFDYPQYTRPRTFRGMKVPDVLFSGDHEAIKYWRRKKSLEKTWRLRPEMLSRSELSPDDEKILEGIKSEMKGKKDESD